MAETNDKPMSELLLQPLDRMEALSKTLFLSLSPPTTRPPPPPLTLDFLACDCAMAAAVQQGRIHQLKQRRIEALKAEILDLDAKVMNLWDELEQGKRELEAIIDEGDERLEAIEAAKKSTWSFSLAKSGPIILYRHSCRPLS